MAYDPEARESSNTAMIIGIVALVLVVGAVLAYYATRDNAPEVVTNPTTVVREEVPANNTVVVAPPAPSTTVIERPVAVPQTRTIERNTTTNTTRVVPAPSGSTTRPSGGSSAPNVTTNVTVQPPASGTSGAGSGANNAGASGGTSSTAPAGDTSTAPADNTADLPAPATP